MLNSTLLLNLGVWQIVLIIAIVLLLFGGRKIPELMRGLGRGIKEFKEGQERQDEETEKEIKS